MNVVVALDVIEPVVVAALGKGNDAVAVIDAVNEHGPCYRGVASDMRARLIPL